MKLKRLLLTSITLFMISLFLIKAQAYYEGYSFNGSAPFGFDNVSSFV